MNKTLPEISNPKFQNTKINLEQNILLPIALVLLIVAFLSAAQDYFVFFKGIHSTWNFLRYYLSKLIYFFYFIPLVILLKFYSKKVLMKKMKFSAWLIIHSFTLVFILYLHQVISFTADKIIFSETYKSTFYMVIYTNPSVWGDFIIYILCTLGFSLINSIKKSRENAIDYSRLEMELARTKLFELRSKIHPKFLFNTLNTISRLIKQNQNREANRVLSRLSEFLRTTVYDSEREEITLREELAFLNHYLEIEKISFENEITFIEKINEQTHLSLVPNFILQPIVENLLYQHEYCKESKIEIAVRTYKVAEDIIMEIEFFHKVFSAKEFQTTSKAIEFAIDQLNQLYRDKYSLQLYSEQTDRLLIKIVLPFHQDFSESEIVSIEGDQV
jgi:two-component system, LytTR family, sensor kinase